MFETESNLSNLPELDIEKLVSVKKVVEFLDKNLLGFTQVFKSKTHTSPVNSEDNVSQILCNYLERKARNEFFMVQFQYRYFETGHSSDFGIIEAEDNYPNNVDSAFFVMEAKRLPADRKSREREYVQGEEHSKSGKIRYTGGVERYKRGIHGRGLPESAMIGYIQDKNNCNHWHQEINKWINDLIKTNTAINICWDEDDLLSIEADLVTTQRYSSKNTRTVSSVNDKIKLHHYLINLS